MCLLISPSVLILTEIVLISMVLLFPLWWFGESVIVPFSRLIIARVDGSMCAWVVLLTVVLEISNFQVASSVVIENFVKSCGNISFLAALQNMFPKTWMGVIYGAR